MKKFSVVLLAMGMGLTMAQGAFATPTYNAVTGHWYDLVSGGASGDWYTAEAGAVGLGGHLVTINDAAEGTWLQSTFGTGLLWIGFTDAGTEGSWYWTSGEAVTFTNWAGGEPNNSSGENYATMNWWVTGEWNDLSPGSSSSGSPFGLYNGVAEWQSSVPEPATYALMLVGLGMMGFTARRRKGTVV